LPATGAFTPTVTDRSRTDSFAGTFPREDTLWLSCRLSDQTELPETDAAPIPLGAFASAARITDESIIEVTRLLIDYVSRYNGVPETAPLLAGTSL